MRDLVERVEQTIATRRLLRRGEAFLVAVSGGVDSMVLLEILHRLASTHAWRLTVAHLNHQLRGRSSDADERFVTNAAERLGRPIVVHRADVKRLVRDEKLSLEMAARKVRHEFLARTALRLRLRTVVLAHHADDQVELFFLRLLRGSGNQGFSGMNWQRASPADPRVRTVRPLLGESKAALRDFARVNRIAFREDATNASTDLRRNRIRHELLPLLRLQYQPALERVILRAIEVAGAETDFVSRAADAWLSDSRAASFEKLHMAVQRQVVQRQLILGGIAPDYELVEALRLQPERPFMISPKLWVSRLDSGWMRFTKASGAPIGFGRSRSVKKMEVAFAGVAGEIDFDGARIVWRIGRVKRGDKIVRRANREVFDADSVGTEVVIRHWEPGDRMQPIGMTSAVKLQDLLTNRKIPQEERHKLMVATTRSGELFWVEKLRISERFKLTDASVRQLEWCWTRV